MVPIKDAISTGNWLHCEIFLGVKFRMKVLSIQKLNFLEVDDPEKIELIDNTGIIWIMDLEVVNLTKGPISTGDVTMQLLLVDKYGKAFRVYGDEHLRYYSEFAKKKKLRRFCRDTLSAKIKAKGAILFQLPQDDEAEYSISIRRGSVKEV